MMSGETYQVNQSEYQAIMKAEKGIFVPRLEVFINKSSVSTAYPEHLADEIEEKRNQMTGILHDGTIVKRHFGQWVDATNQVPDDKGNYSYVVLDPNYYPEVALDLVPTEKEFNKMKHLSSGERLLLIMDGNESKLKRLNEPSKGLEKITFNK